MNFREAVTEYKSDSTPETLSRVTEMLCSELTEREKLRLLRGHAMGATLYSVFRYGRFYNAAPYAAGGCKRLGVPEVRFADGPRGVVTGHCTCFPVSMARGASFDDELEYEIGCAMAKELIASGANYFAGICINLLRHPAWGRAQETYSEDPYLLGRMGSALTRAMVDHSVIACPKHYALNSIEDLRFSVDAKADARTLRETYLPHFKKCIDAGALSIMGAYNRVNGVYSCENRELLTDILRDEWNFDGFTISDFFFGIYDAARSLNAGLDIEMPYSFRYMKLAHYLKTGEISQKTIDESVKRILSVLIRTVPNIKMRDKEVICCKAHTSLARRAAARGTVLIKNNGALPFITGKTALVGRYAARINVGDHGSSNVFSPYTVTPAEGLCKRFGSGNVSVYGGCDTQQALAAAEGCERVVVCVGSDHTQEGEFLVNLGEVKKKPRGSGGDRASLRLPPEDVALIKAITDSGYETIVNIMGGSAYCISEWEDSAAAILMSFYGGLEGGNALADILSGDVNPSGKLPFTVARDEKDYPPFLHIADTAREIDYSGYSGYMYFDKNNTQPDYPFGFGLSYTDFKLSDVKAELTDGVIEVTAEIENTGDFDGETVVQVYVSSLEESSDRPVKALKGFGRVRLTAGEKRPITVSVDSEDIRFYNTETGTWEYDGGYTVFAGLDSRNILPAGFISFGA